MFSKQPDSRKQKREAEEDNITVSQNDTKEDATKDLIDTASEEFEDVISHWKELLPSALGCVASLAGNISLC